MTVYGIDTNIVLRMLVNDNETQRLAVLKFGAGLADQYRGYVTVVSLFEVDWALRSQYGFKKQHVALAIQKLTQIRGLDIESHDLVVFALKSMVDRNVDFADALIALRSAAAGCSSVKTFDIEAAKRIPGMELLT